MGAVNCHKIPYASLSIARQAAYEFNRSLSTRLRAYRCRICDVWHLTSQGNNGR